ncbi:hypothetical protein [Methylobacterium sp. WSM2598]|uniref:hypothetical protein n=1 Tax=Methylobacterium sp. WSM2598 TaxID=398261 RepID=UPI00035E67A4|nr:hypothetical protein [Methylobacterium sp. WSM2598]
MSSRRTRRKAHAEALAAYQFAVFERMFATYGDARAAMLNSDEIKFKEGAPPQSTADMIYEAQIEHDRWLRECAE